MIEFINTRYNKKHLLALIEVGLIPYNTKTRTLDLHGLTRQDLASIRASNGYCSEKFVNEIWRLNPDIFVLSGYETDSGIRKRLGIEVALYKSHDFQKAFQLVKVFGPIEDIYRYSYFGSYELKYFLYERKNLFGSIQES